MDSSKEVFVKTENINEKKEAEKLKEKFLVQREKRYITEKLKNVKSLIDSDDDEDVSDWCLRMREKDSEKDISKKKNQKTS